MKSVLVDLNTFDSEGDQPLYRPFRRSVIYEMHVAGFTRHPNSGVTPANRGTYLGVVEKIPYLQELGVTAVKAPKQATSPWKTILARPESNGTECSSVSPTGE
jgi:pullulanase/glycogen debranching enzyme